VTDMNDPGGMTEDGLVVVVKGMGQKALWLVSVDVPAGWRRQPAWSESG